MKFVGVVSRFRDLATGGALMDDRKRSWAEAAEYQIVLLQVKSALEACERLPHDDRLLLLKKIATRLLQRLSNAPSKVQKEVQVESIEIKSA